MLGEGTGRAAEGGAWEAFVSVFVLLLLFWFSLASVKREGLVSKVFQGREGITARTAGQKEGLSEMEVGSGQHRRRSDTLKDGAVSRLQVTTDHGQQRKCRALLGREKGSL